MFGLSYAKLIGGVAALVLLIGLVLGLRHYKHLSDDRGAQITAACDATRKAADRPKLDCRQMPQQIQFLGDALSTVKAKTEAAKANDAAHAVAVETRQDTTSRGVSNDYQAQIAAVRADYAQRLRTAEASAHLGSRGNAAVPSSSASPGRSDAGSAQGQLPSSDALIATEQAIQLRSMQDWACKQGLYVAKCPAPDPR